MSHPLIWLILFIVFLLVEIFTEGLISIWFAISALILILISKVVPNLILQCLIFVSISGALVYFTKPLVKKYLKKGKPDIDNRIIGQEVKILEKNEFGHYKVYLDGKHWNAKCDSLLEKGDVATVCSFEGNKLVLKK